MLDLQYIDGIFRTVYADPPWKEVGGGKITRGAQKHYELMPTKDIIAMGNEVRRVTADQSHLYLWVTNNFLKDGLAVMEGWGYTYITTITWMKNKMGLGQYYRGMTEHCLFGRRGKALPYKLLDTGKRAQGKTGFYAEKQEHSAKPTDMREMIERVSYGPYLELFGRQLVAGWDVWGDQAYD